MLQDVNRTGNILYTGKSCVLESQLFVFYIWFLNGVLSEFLAAALEAKGNIDNRRLADAFHELDEDGSGYISNVSRISAHVCPAVHQTYHVPLPCP